jgi:CBS domain containing-hemolysin-like protein
MDIVHLIQSAVAPVFLLSGVGVTLGVLTNRLARIVDRARVLEDRIENGSRSAHSLHKQLEVLARRSRYINTAITMCAISALLVALVVITLFANAFFAAGFAATIAILFVGAMVFLTAAFLTFLIEVRIATAALRFGPPGEHVLPPDAAEGKAPR